MEKRLQQRLIGAAVIIALAVIFLPMLLNGGGNNHQVSMTMKIPPEPSYTFNGAAQPPAASTTAPLQPVNVVPPANAPAQTIASPPAVEPKIIAPAQSAQTTSPTPAPPASAPAPTATPTVEPKITAPAQPVKASPPQPPAVAAKPSPAPQIAQKPAKPAAKAPPPATPPQNQVALSSKAVTPAWVVQVASLLDEARAKGVRDQLRKGGFAAYIDRFDDKGKVFYRIRVGPKLTRTGAEAQLVKVKKAFGYQGIVVPYQ